MILRRNSSLLINLFVIMLSSGISELESINDIMHLKNKLVPDYSQENALKFFQDQFNEAINLSFTTRFDWFFHAFNHRK